MGLSWSEISDHCRTENKSYDVVDDKNRVVSRDRLCHNLVAVTTENV